MTGQRDSFETLVIEPSTGTTRLAAGVGGKVRWQHSRVHGSSGAVPQQHTPETLWQVSTCNVLNWQTQLPAIIHTGGQK